MSYCMDNCGEDFNFIGEEVSHCRISTSSANDLLMPKWGEHRYHLCAPGERYEGDIPGYCLMDHFGVVYQWEEGKEPSRTEVEMVVSALLAGKNQTEIDKGVLC